MFRRIAWQLTSSYLVVILFSMGILGFYMLKALEENFEHELTDGVRQQAHLLAATWSSVLEEGHVNEHQKSRTALLARALNWQNGSRLRILNAHGKVIVDTGTPSDNNLALRPAVRAAMGGEEQTGVEPDPLDPHSTQVYVAYPVRVRRPDLQAPGGSKETVQGAVFVNRSTTYVRFTLQRLRGLFLVGTFISLLFSGTLSLFLSHYMSGPLREIAGAADRMAAGDLSIQVPTASGNEIGELAERFNFMARQLRASTALLIEEKNKLAVVLTQMADGVVMFDDRGKVVLSNPSADEMLQAPTLDDEEHPLHNLRGGMKRALRNGVEEFNEIALSGGRVARVAYSPVMSARGEILGCVVILHDITELRRLSELKTEFVSNVSHELKTPLAAVKGLSEILLDGALHEKQAEKFIRSIGREVERMTRLVMDLLNLSKIESGVVKMDVRPFDLGALVRDVAAGFMARSPEGSARIEVAADAAGVWALGDSDRVEQVVVNLLDNAVRYSPAEASVEVRVKESAGVCQVEVEDHGIGIPAAELPRIFQRFYRVDKARSREQGGTGLGLSIARQIVERLHGKIWAESGGHGSTFVFVLPAAPHETAEEPTEEIFGELPG